MASFNKTIVVGNLGRDVEVRYTPSGAAVANITIAVTEKYTTKSGEKREDTLWLECVLWNKTAELASEYLSKGKSVLFEGKLKQEEWNDKETGQKRSKIVLNVETMQFLGAPSGGQQSPAAGQRPARTRSEPARQASISYDEVTGAPGEDVPF